MILKKNDFLILIFFLVVHFISFAENENSNFKNKFDFNGNWYGLGKANHLNNEIPCNPIQLDLKIEEFKILFLNQFEWFCGGSHFKLKPQKLDILHNKIYFNDKVVGSIDNQTIELNSKIWNGQNSKLVIKLLDSDYIDIYHELPLPTSSDYYFVFGSLNRAN